MNGATGLSRLELRRRRTGVVGLGILVAILGAAVVGPLAGARRTATAYERLVRATAAADVLISSPMFDPYDLPIGAAPTVASVRKVGAFIGRVDGTKDWMYQFAGPDGVRPGVLVAGRWWSDPADDEVVISEVTAKNTGLGVGSGLAYTLYTPEQFRSVADLSFEEPAGPSLRLRVVGVAHVPDDAQADPTTKMIWAGPSFYQRHRGAVTIHNAAVRLRRGLSDIDAFAADLGRARDVHSAALGVPSEALFVDQDDRTAQRAAGREATRVATTGLLAFAAVAAAAGLGVVVQTYRRQLGGVDRDQALFHVLGFDRRQRLAALAAPGTASALLGGAISLLGSVALSPLFPIGRARELEPNPGVDVDVLLVLGGAAAWTVLVAVATGGVAFAELLRTSSGRGAGRRTRRLQRALVATGARAPLTLGVGLATDPGRAPDTVPVRSTLVGTAVGVAGLLAAASFDLGLRTLLDAPGRFGLAYDLSVETSTSDEAGLTTTLLDDPDVAAVARVWQATVGVDGRAVESYALEKVKGTLDPTLSSGRLPSTGEVAVGPQLLRSLRKRIGDDVAVEGPLGTRTLRVVGSALSPQESADPFNGEVFLHPHDQAALVDHGQRFPELTVRFAPGADREAEAAALDSRYPFGVIDESWPHPPSEIAQLAQLRPVVSAVGVLFVTVLLGSMTHGIVVMLRRHRQDLVILRAIGFSPRQLAVLTTTSAATIAAAALVAGLPLGVLVGAVSWTSVADGLDVAVPWPWPLAVSGLSVCSLLLLSTALAVAAARPVLTAPISAGLRRD